METAESQSSGSIHKETEEYVETLTEASGSGENPPPILPTSFPEFELPSTGSLDYPEAPPTTPLMPEDAQKQGDCFRRKLKSGLAKEFSPSAPPTTPKDLVSETTMSVEEMERMRECGELKQGLFQEFVSSLPKEESLDKDLTRNDGKDIKRMKSQQSFCHELKEGLFKEFTPFTSTANDESLDDETTKEAGEVFPPSTPTLKDEQFSKSAELEPVQMMEEGMKNLDSFCGKLKRDLASAPSASKELVSEMTTEMSKEDNQGMKSQKSFCRDLKQGLFEEFAFSGMTKEHNERIKTCSDMKDGFSAPTPKDKRFHERMELEPELRSKDGNEWVTDEHRMREFAETLSLEVMKHVREEIELKMENEPMKSRESFCPRVKEDLLKEFIEFAERLSQDVIKGAIEDNRVREDQMMKYWESLDERTEPELMSKDKVEVKDEDRMKEFAEAVNLEVMKHVREEIEWMTENVAIKNREILAPSASPVDERMKQFAESLSHGVMLDVLGDQRLRDDEKMENHNSLDECSDKPLELEPDLMHGLTEDDERLREFAEALTLDVLKGGTHRVYLELLASQVANAVVQSSIAQVKE